MVETRVHEGELVPPGQSLESYFRDGGATVVQAAFEHSYFAHPDRIRGNTPLYPDRARRSREHYPKLDKGARAEWHGRGVKLDDNSKAQQAWKRYSGRPIQRGSGYGVRHVWGHPWDPEAFTAGWNLCYMPFWAGMLTERQHPHPELGRAVRQAAWDLYFRQNPVCDPPDFVTNPGLDLDVILRGQPVLILAGNAPTAVRSVLQAGAPGEDVDLRLNELRNLTRQSSSNLLKAVLSLQGKPHEPFSTGNVQATAESTVRRMQRETGRRTEPASSLGPRGGRSLAPRQPTREAAATRNGQIDTSVQVETLALLDHVAARRSKSPIVRSVQLPALVPSCRHGPATSAYLRGTDGCPVSRQSDLG